ncbi:MAG: hypothetical protein P8Y70_11115, partial [Candidatus Lokiarchaeota archaeon]
EKLEDLIFAGSKGKNPSIKASVTLYFDNSEGIFPGGTDEFQITRVVRKGKGNKYKMNEKVSTRQQILNALASANIDPDGSNQFVLQGKIVELTHMNIEERRAFIEELIGLQKYDDMKEETMKELEKAERDLSQFEAIFKEVSSQLKKVEKEKNDALAWKELDEKIKSLNAKLIAVRISKLEEEERELERKIENSQKIIEELNEKISKRDDLLKQESLVMENIQNGINEKEGEKEQINENVTQLKTQLSSKETSLELAKKSLKKLGKEKENLISLLLDLEEGKTTVDLIKENESLINECERKIEDSTQEINKRQQTQSEIEEHIKKKEEEKSNLKAEISTIKQNVSSNKAEIKMLNENIKKNI